MQSFRQLAYVDAGGGGVRNSAREPAMQQTLPVPFYRDPAVFAEERRRIFARTWQFLGLEADLTETGDFISRELAGYPILALRDEAGAIRAFHNVCRHRAGPLVDAPKGRCEGALVCRYHGWRYALDGRLRSAADFGATDGFDPRDFGLHPLKVETWRGLVFVNADADAEPLSALTAPIDALLGERVFPSEPYRESHPIACNWKVYVENYLEGYHIEQVHPTLAARWRRPPTACGCRTGSPSTRSRPGAARPPGSGPGCGRTSPSTSTTTG